jgi:phospholipid/cholesterol/gamma-HCH transport system ATP-binding protein
MDEIILELKNIHKNFGKNPIHRGISLSLKRGESLGLLGGSGAGKSALLRSIIGLERIDSGEIYFQNKRIDHLDENELRIYRTRISYSFQSGALFDSINVFENIAYPLFEHTKLSFNEIKNKVREMLSLIDLPGREEVMPSDLSGGMQKRVGMARAIILHPDIILYDEPTAGLDPSNTLNVIALMEKLKKSGLASIFVTHDIPSAIMLCDRIVVLHQGVIIFNGTPQQFEQSDDPVVRSFITNKG